MDMQMSSNRRANAIRRQHIISQSSSINQSQTSSPLSKKRRLQLSPPTTETNISQSLSLTPTQTPLLPSTSCRRCSSPSRLISVENRPPRHPDSPIPTSSSSLCHIPQFCSRHDIIDDYTNEKYPKELLARIERTNSYTNIVDNEQRDEQEDEHRSIESNDTFCLSIDTEDDKVLQKTPVKTDKDKDSSSTTLSVVKDQKKDSILDFFKRLPNTLIKRRREEKDSNINDKSVSCEVGVVSPIYENEILDEQQQQQQHKVVSNDTFRLLLSRSQEEEAFDGVSDSLHLKSESSESELQKKVLPDKFECLDIWP